MPNTLAGAEQFVSLGTASVTAGGTTAPLAGTQETWTLSGSSLPAASSAAGTGFYMADTLQPSEVILVTNISGVTATVVRGADGTTPVAHSSPFTVIQVASGATFRALQQPWVVLPSGDTTGATDPVNVQAAINTYGHATIGNGFGSYYGNATVIGTENQYVNCIGMPTWTLKATGIPAFQWKPANPAAYGVKAHGGIRGRLNITGVSATACPADGSIGVQMGDIPHLECDIQVTNCQWGLLISNQNFWTEQGTFRVYSQGCTNPVVEQIAATGGANRTGSMERNEITVYHNETMSGAFGLGGVQVLAGALHTGGFIKQYGNWGGTGQAGVYALYVSGQAPASSAATNFSTVGAGTNARTDTQIIHHVEYNGTGTGPNSMFVDTSCSVTAWGDLEYAWLGWGTTPVINGTFDFFGPCSDTTLLAKAWTTLGGLPAGYSGFIKYKKVGGGQKVGLAFQVTIATTTVVSQGTNLGTLPSGFFNPNGFYVAAATISGGGLTGTQLCPIQVRNTGAAGELAYEGPAFTVTGSVATILCYCEIPLAT